MLSQILHSPLLKLQWLCLATLFLYLSYASATDLKVTYSYRHEYYDNVFSSAHSILIEGVPLSDLDQFYFVLDPWFYGLSGPYEVNILDGVDDPNVQPKVGLNVMAVERIVNDLSMLMVRVPDNQYRDVTVFRINLPYDYNVFTDIPAKDAVIGAYQAFIHGLPEPVWGIIPRTPFVMPFSAYVVPHLYRINSYQLVVVFPLAVYPVMSAYPSISLDLSSTVMLSPDSCYSLIVQSKQVCSMLTNHASPLKDPHLPQSNPPLYAFRIDLSNYSPFRIGKNTVLPNIALVIPVRVKTDPDMFDYLIPVPKFPALYNISANQSLHPRYAVFAASHAALRSPFFPRNRASRPLVIPENSDSSLTNNIYYGDDGIPPGIEIDPVIDVDTEVDDGGEDQERVPFPDPGGDEGKDGLIPFYPTASAIEGVLLSSSLRFIDQSSMLTFGTSVHAYMSSMSTPIFSSTLSSSSLPPYEPLSSSPSPSSATATSSFSPLRDVHSSHATSSSLSPPMSPATTAYVPRVFPVITTPPPFPSTITDANEAGVLIRVGMQAIRKNDIIQIYQDSKAPLFPTGSYACTSGKCTLSPDLEFLECIISENVSQDFSDNGYYQVLITSSALDYSRVGDVTVYHVVNGEHVAGSRMHHFGKLRLINNLRISYTFPKIEEFSVPFYLSSLPVAHEEAIGVSADASAVTPDTSLTTILTTDGGPTRVTTTTVSPVHRVLRSLFTRLRLHTHLSSTSSTSSAPSSLPRFPPAPAITAPTAFRLSTSTFSLTLTADEFTSGASYAGHRLRIYWPCTLIQSEIIPLQRRGDARADAQTRSRDTHTTKRKLSESSSDTRPASSSSPPRPPTRSAAHVPLTDLHLSVSVNGLPCYTAHYLTECEVPYGHDDATAGRRRSIEIIAENVYMSVLQRPAVLTITRVHALSPEKVLEFSTVVIPGISKLSIAPTHHISVAADRKSVFLTSNVKITGISPVITPPDDDNITPSPPSPSVAASVSLNASSTSTSPPSPLASWSRSLSYPTPSTSSSPRPASSSAPCHPTALSFQSTSSPSVPSPHLAPSGTLAPASPCFFAIYARTDHLTISFSAPLLANTTKVVGNELVTYTPKAHAQLYDTVGKKMYDLSCNIFNNHTLNCVSLADMFVHVHIVPKPDAWIAPPNSTAAQDNVHVQILVNITSPYTLVTEDEAAQVYTRFFIYTDTRKDMCHLPESLPVDRSILTPNLPDYYPQLYQHDDPHSDMDDESSNSSRVAAASPSGNLSDIKRHATHLHSYPSLPVHPAKGPSTPRPDPYAVDRGLFFTGMTLQRSLDSASVVMYSDPYLLPLPGDGVDTGALTVVQVALICVFGGLVLAAGVGFFIFWRRRSHAKHHAHAGDTATATATANAAGVARSAGVDKFAIELTTVASDAHTDTTDGASVTANSPSASHRAAAKLQDVSTGTPCASAGLAGQDECDARVKGSVRVIHGEDEESNASNTPTSTRDAPTSTTASTLPHARTASPKPPRARTPVPTSAQSTALASMGLLVRTLLHSVIATHTQMHAQAQAQSHAGTSDDANANTNTTIDATPATDVTAAAAPVAVAPPTRARAWSVGGRATGDRAMSSAPHAPSPTSRPMLPPSPVASPSPSSLSLYPSAIYPPNHISLPSPLPFLPIASIAHSSSPLSFSLAFPIRCKPSASLLLAPDGSLAALVPYLGVYSQDRYRKACVGEVEVCGACGESGDGGRVCFGGKDNFANAGGNGDDGCRSDQEKPNNSANTDTNINTVASTSTSTTRLAHSRAAPMSTLVVTHAHVYPSLLFACEAYLLHARVDEDEIGGVGLSSIGYIGRDDGHGRAGDGQRGNCVEATGTQTCAKDEGQEDMCVRTCGRVVEGVSADAQSPALNAYTQQHIQQHTQPQQSDAGAGYRHLIPPFYAPARHITVDKHLYYSITFPTQRALDATQRLHATTRRTMDATSCHLGPVSDMPPHTLQCSAGTGAEHGQTASDEYGSECGDAASALMHDACSSPSQVYPHRDHGYYPHQAHCHGRYHDYTRSHVADCGSGDGSCRGGASGVCDCHDRGSWASSDDGHIAKEAGGHSDFATICSTDTVGVACVASPAHALARSACGVRQRADLAAFATVRHGRRYGDRETRRSSSDDYDVCSAPSPVPAPICAMAVGDPHACSLPMLQCKDLPALTHPSLSAAPASLPSSLSSSSSCLYSHLQWEQTRVKHSIILQFTLFGDRDVRRFISPSFRGCMAMIGSDPAYLPCFDAYLLLVLSLAEHESEVATHHAGLAALRARDLHAPHAAGAGVGVCGGGACGSTPSPLPAGATIVCSSGALGSGVESENSRNGVIDGVEGMETDARKSGKHVHFDDLHTADHACASEEQRVEVRAGVRSEGSQESPRQQLRMGAFDETDSPAATLSYTLSYNPTHTHAPSSSSSSSYFSGAPPHSCSHASPRLSHSSVLCPLPRSLAPEVTLNEALHRDLPPVLPRHTCPRPIYTCPRLDVPAHVSTAELSRFANDGDHYIIADDEIVYLSKQRPRVRSNPYHNIKLSSLALAGQIINFVPATAVNYKFFTRAANAPPHEPHARYRPQHATMHATHQAAVGHPAQTSANASGGVKAHHHPGMAFPRPAPAPALQPAYTIDNTEYRCSPLQYAYSMMQHALMVQGMLPKHTRLGKDASPNTLQASALTSNNLQNRDSLKIPYSPFRSPVPAHTRVDSDPLEVDMREAFPVDPEPENSGMNSGVPRVFSEEMGCTSPTTFVAKQYVRERLLMQAQAQAHAQARAYTQTQMQVQRGTSSGDTSDSNSTPTATPTSASDSARNHYHSHSYVHSYACSHSRSQSRAHGHNLSHSCSRSRSHSYCVEEFDRSGSTGNSDSVLHSHDTNHSRGYEFTTSSHGSGLSSPYNGGGGSGTGSNGDSVCCSPMPPPSCAAPPSSSTGISGIRLSGLGASSITVSGTGALSLTARESSLHHMPLGAPRGQPQWTAEEDCVAGVAGAGNVRDNQLLGRTGCAGAAGVNNGLGAQHGVGIGMNMGREPVTMDQIVYTRSHPHAARDNSAVAAREVHQYQQDYHQHQHRHTAMAHYHDRDVFAHQQRQRDVIAQQELWLSHQEHLRHTHGESLRKESSVCRTRTVVDTLQRPPESHLPHQQQQLRSGCVASQSHNDAAHDHLLPHSTQHVPHTALLRSSPAPSLPAPPRSPPSSSQAPSSLGPSPNTLFSSLPHNHALPVHAQTLPHKHMQARTHVHAYMHSVPQPQSATLSLPSPTSDIRSSLCQPGIHAPPHAVHEATKEGSSADGTVSLSAEGVRNGGGQDVGDYVPHDNMVSACGFSDMPGMAGMGTATMGTGVGSLGSHHGTNPSNHAIQHGMGAANLSLTHVSAPQLHPPVTPITHGPSHVRPHRPHSAHAVAGATHNGPVSTHNDTIPLSPVVNTSAAVAGQGNPTTALGVFANPHGMMSLQEHANTQPSLCVPSRADQSPVHLEEIMRNSHHSAQHTLGGGVGGFPVHLNASTITPFARETMPNGHMILPTSGIPRNTHAPPHLQPIPDVSQPVFLNDIQNPACRPHASLPHMHAPQTMQLSHDYPHNHPTFSLLTDLQNLHASRAAGDTLTQHNPALCMPGGVSSHLVRHHPAAGVGHATHPSASGSSTSAHIHPHQPPHQQHQQQRLQTLSFQQQPQHHPIYVQHPYIPGMYSLASIRPVPPSNNSVAVPPNMHTNGIQPIGGLNTHMHANDRDMCRDISCGTDGIGANPHLGTNMTNVSVKSSTPINSLNVSLHAQTPGAGTGSSMSASTTQGQHGGLSSYHVPPAPVALQQHTYFPSARMQ